MTCPLHALSDGTLRALAASLRSGVLSGGMSRGEIDRMCGDDSAVVSNYLSELYLNGFSPKHILAIARPWSSYGRRSNRFRTFWS